MNPMRPKTVPRVPVTKNPDTTNCVVRCPKVISITCEFCGTRKTDKNLYNVLWTMWFHQTAVHNRDDPEPVKPSKGKIPDDPEAAQLSKEKISDDPEAAQPSNEKISDDPEAAQPSNEKISDDPEAVQPSKEKISDDPEAAQCQLTAHSKDIFSCKKS